VSAHSASHRRGVLAALAAQLSAYVLEPVEQTVEPEPAELAPYPVVAVVSAAARSGATSVARMLAAELASRADGAAVVVAGRQAGRRGAPPSRAASRLATALHGASSSVRPLGRLCLAADADVRRVVTASRYLAPVVLDCAPDGSGPFAAGNAERTLVVVAATQEPALAGAVARVLGGAPLCVVNRAGEPGEWQGRADIFIPDARIAARAALVGTRPLGPLGAAIAGLADALDVGL
jgi:hypothetical protein